MWHPRTIQKYSINFTYTIKAICWNDIPNKQVFIITSASVLMQLSVLSRDVKICCKRSCSAAIFTLSPKRMRKSAVQCYQLQSNFYNFGSGESHSMSHTVKKNLISFTTYIKVLYWIFHKSVKMHITVILANCFFDLKNNYKELSYFIRSYTITY